MPFTTHCSLFTAHYSSLTTHCSLLTAHYSLLAIRYSLSFLLAHAGLGEGRHLIVEGQGIVDQVHGDSPPRALS